MLTDAKVRTLKAKPGRYEVSDSGRNGLVLRVTPNGIKTWVLRYRFDDRFRRLTLGTWGPNDPGGPAEEAGDRAEAERLRRADQSNVSLAEARRRALEARSQISAGVDPGQAKQEAKISARAGRDAERAAMTVAKLCSLYLDLWAKPNKRSWREDERQIHSDVAPTLKDPKSPARWDHLKAKDITRADVQALLDAIAARGAPVAANRMKALLSRLFRWALARSYVGSNPVAGIEQPAREQPKDRVLNEAEVRTFWSGLDATPLSDAVKGALRLILITGQRPGEVAGMRYEELTEEGGRVLWKIPGPRRKSGEAHIIPLSSLALEVVGDWKGRSGYVFEGPPRRAREPEEDEAQDPAPVTTRTLSQALRRSLGDPAEERVKAPPKKRGKRKRVLISVAEFSAHDLRRTAATLMTNAGVSGLVKPLILGHAPQDITRKVYDLYDYLDEKTRALDAWARRLRIIAAGEEPEKVIRLRTGNGGAEEDRR
ncbi:MAG: integrase arm-type DNA-binding domain-containing protein [Deltaproteobacteria bacterium]|nr:integrase arm-type DNA-binding domain-containing protein [Deltaproteobacteria bacterium]